MTPTTSDYLLGHDPPEVRRLLDQAAMFEREVRWLFEEIGPRSYTDAIDLGCGPRGVLPELCRIVGPTGRIVGVDADPVMIAHARRTCDTNALTNIELHCIIATNTGIPDGSFDLAHIRLLLVNIAEPAAVLTEAVRLLRPGGIVAVQEIDWLSWQCEPPHPAWDQLRDALR